jgi:hypothetical protein
MTMTADYRTVDLLGQLLARRTDPGRGHVILSEAEYDERLHRVFLAYVASYGNPETRIAESAIQMVRNRLVHGQFETSDVDRLTETLTVVLEAGLPQPPEAAFEEALRTLRRQRADEGISAAESVADVFVEELTSHAELLGKLDDEEAMRLGRRAAADVLAGARWAQVVGDRLDTSQVTQLLGVTRQALAKRQQTGSLLGLPGDGTTWYPTWQLDSDKGRIRPEVRDVLGAFRDRLDGMDPLVIAAWATTPQDEDLAGETPAQWLRAGRDQDQLRRAAERAAARLCR